jgi:hypothetical protein
MSEQLREKYPFKPYGRALISADEVEVVSYPWQERDGNVYIKVRLTPGDPASITIVDANRLSPAPAVDWENMEYETACEFLSRELSSIPQSQWSSREKALWRVLCEAKKRELKRREDSNAADAES